MKKTNLLYCQNRASVLSDLGQPDINITPAAVLRGKKGNKISLTEDKAPHQNSDTIAYICALKKKERKKWKFALLWGPACESESFFISAWDYLGFIDIAENFCEEAIYWLFLWMIHFEPNGKHIITQRNALNQRAQSYNVKRWGSNQGQPEDLLSFYIQSEGEQLSEKYILCDWWRINVKKEAVTHGRAH